MHERRRNVDLRVQSKVVVILSNLSSHSIPPSILSPSHSKIKHHSSIHQPTNQPFILHFKNSHSKEIQQRAKCIPFPYCLGRTMMYQYFMWANMPPGRRCCCAIVTSIAVISSITVVIIVAVGGARGSMLLVRHGIPHGGGGVCRARARCRVLLHGRRCTERVRGGLTLYCCP